MEKLDQVSPEIEGLTISFAERYIRLQLQKKSLCEDVKELKKEFEEQGLPTKQVIKAIDRIRKELKEGSDSEVEINTFKNMLYDKTIIQDRKSTRLNSSHL